MVATPPIAPCGRPGSDDPVRGTALGPSWLLGREDTSDLGIIDICDLSPIIDRANGLRLVDVRPRRPPQRDETEIFVRTPLESVVAAPIEIQRYRRRGNRIVP